MKNKTFSQPARALSLALAFLQALTSIAPVSVFLATGRSVYATTDPVAATAPVRAVTRRPGVQAPRSILPHFSASPTDSELFSVQIFPVALLPVGATAPADNRALADALTAYVQRTNVEAQSILVNFLDGHTNSAWKTALLVNLGIMWRQTGYFPPAMTAWQDAWKLSKDKPDYRSKSLADRALAELSQLYAWVGEYTRLEPLLAEVGDRKLLGGSAEMLADSRDGLWVMKNRPDGGFLCGPFALQEILGASSPGT